MSDVADLGEQYCHFFDEDEFEATERPGFRRRVITGDALQLCFWRIDGGASGSYLHRHDAHEQLGIVMRGALDFRIGDPGSASRQVLRAGEVYLAPVSVWHGDSTFIGDDELGECWILDVFSPPRDDLREARAEPDVVRLETPSPTNGATTCPPPT